MTPYASSYAPSAEADLANLYDYIAERASESIARNYINRIQDECESLAHTPMRGTIRDELGPNLRSIGFERRATILFRVERKVRKVTVLGVSYGGLQVEAPEWSCGPPRSASGLGVAQAPSSGSTLNGIWSSKCTLSPPPCSRM